MGNDCGDCCNRSGWHQTNNISRQQFGAAPMPYNPSTRQTLPNSRPDPNLSIIQKSNHAVTCFNTQTPQSVQLLPTPGPNNPVTNQPLRISQMIAQQAAGFSLNVRDPEGINLRASRIIISGVNDHAPHADETAAHSLFVGAKNTQTGLPIINIQGLVTATKIFNGITYNGTWKGDLRYGQGQQIWPDNSSYQGAWADGFANGPGKFKFANGDIYDGHFSKDMANGAGKLTRIDGSVSEGVWWDDQMHGYGSQIWPDGSKYEGNFNRGRKHGPGRYIWPDGSEYFGNWVEGFITGHGRAYWCDGRIYDGDWLNNKKHGRGVHTWPDGRRYEGAYEGDLRHGIGTLILPNGTKYSGQWARGRRHGKGSQTYPDKRVINGIWENGKMVQQA